MIQLQAFRVPAEQEKANEFLRTHKPAGPLQFNKDTVFVFYDDGTYPAEYEISDLEELIQANRNSRIQQEIALHTMKADLAGLNPSHNKGKHEELSHAISQTQKATDLSETKAEYLRGRIEGLRKAE